MQSNVLNQIFLEKYTLQHLAKRRPNVGIINFRYRFRQALRRFVKRPSPQKIPSGPLILLADGLFFYFKKRAWVLYLMALKSSNGKTAVFLDPVLLPERESAEKWKQVFETIPLKIKKRIKALVVDNLNGMKKITKQENWVLQLCHFHLILKFQVQHRRQRRALLGGAMRDEIYQLINQILNVSNGPLLNIFIVRLTQLAQNPCITYRIQATIREFLSSMMYYRTYRTYPALGLPSTTNTIESMNCIIRDLLRRNHSASNPKSLLRWATALVRLRKKLNCNGKYYQQN
jgi:transposase-like protein